MTTCLFFDIDEEAKAYLSNHIISGYDFVFLEQEFNDPKTITLEKYKNAEIISVFPHSEGIKNAYLDFFPDLKLIATRSTGYNHIDLDYAKARGISVVNVPNYGEVTVAEFTMGTMIG